MRASTFANAITSAGDKEEEAQDNFISWSVPAIMPPVGSEPSPAGSKVAVTYKSSYNPVCKGFSDCFKVP